MKRILLFLMLLIFPFVVNAKEYKVVEHYIDSQVEIAGGLTVRELIIVENAPDIFNRKVNYYSFGKTSWDGKEVDLALGTIYNGDSISTLSVSAFEAPESVNMNNLKEGAKEFFKPLNLNNPKDNTYLGTDNKDGTFNYNINYKPTSEKTAYYLEYSITGITVKHNDIKEVNYSFKNLNYNAKNTIIRMLLPFCGP